MTKPKHIDPADPVATNPDVRKLELANREKIARLKEADMEAGRKESLSVSLMVSNLDAAAVGWAKVKGGGRKGSDIANARRLKEQVSPTEIARAYADLELAHPKWTKGKRECAVAKKFGVSQSTVYRRMKK